MATLAGLIILSLLISALGLYSIPRYYRAAKDSVHWRRVPGILLKCELIERRWDGHRQPKFGLDIKYSYQVDTEVFESTKVSFYFGQWSTSRSYYTRIRDIITKGSDLTVYVNPNNPRESVLIPGADQLPGWMLATICVMMVVCPICGFFAIYELFLRPLGVP